MFAFVLAIFVFVAFIIWGIYEHEGVGDTLFISMVSGLLALIVGFFIALIGGAIFSADEDNKAIISSETVELYALQDGNMIEGYGCFLGGAYIDEELQYTFMYYEEGKGYTTDSVDADTSYLNYTNSEAPTVTEIVYGFDSEFLNFMFLPCWNDEYYFNIPEGSIIMDYRIDLQ